MGLALGIALVVGGCASGGGGGERVGAGGSEAIVGGEERSEGVAEDRFVSAGEASGGGVERSVEVADGDGAGGASVEGLVERGGEREDGRPAWWFDGVGEHGGRAAVCVEALGSGVVETRRAVVERARAEGARRLGAGSVRIEFVSVRPVPNAGGELRFVGYALVSPSG